MDRERSSKEGTPSDSSPLRKWTEERECYEEIAEYIKEVDEILDFIKPFPRDRFREPGHTLFRSTSTDSSDHLGNLIKLVEQLKELKDKDSKINERAQYLKDLKKLRERKKLLKYEAELGTPPYWGDVKQDEKCRSSLPFRKTTRGRSKSVNMDEIVKDEDVRFPRGRFPSDEQQRRKLSTGSPKPEKSKVSKWTKVKEAFRWEKASVESKRREDVQYLQVPQDKTPESLSDSPVSGQVSGSSSVGAPSTICLAVSSGYSGEHSSEGHSTSSGCDLPPPPPPPPPLPSEEDFLSLPLIQDMSSSSSSEKLDELITYSELLAKGKLARQHHLEPQPKPWKITGEENAKIIRKALTDAVPRKISLTDCGNDKSELIADSFDVAFQDDHGTDDLESRRSKSLDGDTVLGPGSSLMQHLSKESLTYSKKAHKTAWGKVKDIIQTRKDSLKKKPKKRYCEKGDEGFSGFELEGQEDPPSPEDKPKDMSIALKPRIELTESSEVALQPLINKPAADSVAKRRLTPVLTITLPSTEELRSISSAEGDANVVQKPSTAEEKLKMVSEGADYFEDIPKYEKNKMGSNHRFSKWSKVKRAFLTNPSRSSEFSEANSVPSSPSKQMSFFSDVESDELSSGEWTDNKIQSQEKAVTEAESPGIVCHEDIQKHYLELNHKLTQEFDQKLREWERMKSETKVKHEGPFQRQKSEGWDKMPRSATHQRESMTIPLPKLDDLSPEFKKKLDEWKKIKKSQTLSAVPGTSPKDETQGQYFKMRIGEWQRWRPRSNNKMTKSEQNEEFAKKLEEWQRIKGTVRRSRSQSDRGKEDIRNRSPSPSLRRKNSKKKPTSSGKSSGTESLSGSLKEKDGRSGCRKQQKEKDLQWLEKELHKIERGKMRLEREKEKFLEREARLEKMKRTMGTTSPTQEILIKTPTGFFRFEGISQKFTKKLYEWEKARGIAPEASTFALLEEYVNRNERDDSRSNGMSLQRSKSMGSVMEVSSVAQDLPHHPSSLSLNDVDELGIEESRASSEPALGQDEDEPQAIIVDVEDVVEETAALMADTPTVKGEVPVYSYAPEEVTQLIDSSDSDGESKVQIVGEAGVGERTLEERGTSSRKFGDDREQDASKDKPLQQVSPRSPQGMNQQEAVSHVHELSSQLLCLAEKLEMALNDDNKKVIRNALYDRRRQARCLKLDEKWRTEEEPKDESDFLNKKSSIQELAELPTLITNKVLELKCGLNVLKTATESPGQESTIFEFRNQDYSEQDQENTASERINLGVEEENNKTNGEHLKSLEKLKAQVLGDYDNHKEDAKFSPELIKRKIKEKISLMQRMTTEARPRSFKPFEEIESMMGGTAEDIDEKVVVVRKNSKGSKQKLLKTRRVTDTTIAYKQVTEEGILSSERDDEVLVEAKSKCYASPNTEDGTGMEKTPVNVFVPTTRKIISPVRRDGKGTTSILSYIIDDITPDEEKNKNEMVSLDGRQSDLTCEREATSEKGFHRDIGIPPLPNSPLSPRKLTSPSIRMMIAKYNQKLERSAGTDTGRSSPSWRSPIFERKLQDISVQKSASAGLIINDEKTKTSEESLKGILKSSSAGTVKEPGETEIAEPTASRLRALRIKKAKEEFLSRGPENWTSTASTPTTELPSNRLSHASVGSESSCDEAFDSNLIKSASAGTINMEETSRRSSDVERSDDSCKTTAKTSSKFGIFSIKSRFRKVRMKKAKEKDSRGGAVSTLCRQSLLLEVPVCPETMTDPCTSKSCPSSPVLERSKAKTDIWMRGMFRMKETKPEMP